MRWRAKTLICFWLSHVAFVSSAWKQTQWHFPTTTNPTLLTKQIWIYGSALLFPRPTWETVLANLGDVKNLNLSTITRETTQLSPANQNNTVNAETGQKLRLPTIPAEMSLTYLTRWTHDSSMEWSIKISFNVPPSMYSATSTEKSGKHR